MAQRTTNKAATLIAKLFSDDGFTKKEAIEEMIELKDEDGERLYRAPFIIKILNKM